MLLYSCTSARSAALRQHRTLCNDDDYNLREDVEEKGRSGVLPIRVQLPPLKFKTEGKIGARLRWEVGRKAGSVGTCSKVATNKACMINGPAACGRHLRSDSDRVVISIFGEGGSPPPLGSVDSPRHSPGERKSRDGYFCCDYCRETSSRDLGDCRVGS